MLISVVGSDDHCLVRGRGQDMHAGIKKDRESVKQQQKEAAERKKAFQEKISSFKS